MTMCPLCGKELREEATFCDGCGVRISEAIVCPACGEQLSTEGSFCQSGDTPTAQNSFEKQPTTALPATAPEEKRLPKKAVILAAIGVIVIAVLVIILSLVFGGGNAKNNYALYVKNQKIFYNNLKADSKAWALTFDLSESDSTDDKVFSDIRDTLGIYTYISKDGNYIFFLDRLSDKQLCYKEINNPEAEAVQIDSRVVTYTVNDSATIVTYLSAENSSLYQYKIGDGSKEKIADETNTSYTVSDDGLKIVYTDSEGHIFLKYAGKDKEEIASEGSQLVSVSKDLSTVCYIKDGDLYKQTEGQSKTKIASDIYQILRTYNSGEIYYLKKESDNIFLKDYVTDDRKDYDASVREPKAPSLPLQTNYKTSAEYEAAYAAYETAYKAYEAEYEDYCEKTQRDSLREQLKEKTIKNPCISLCFFNGSEEIVVADSCAYLNYNCSPIFDTPVIFYTAYTPVNPDKIKLSEIGSVYEVEEAVITALMSSPQQYVAIKHNAAVIEQKNVKSFTMNDSGTVAYYIDGDPANTDYGELYRISIEDGAVKKSELYDSDVYSHSCSFINDGQFAYFKNYKDGGGELYINKEKIDDTVNIYSIDFDAVSNKPVYLADWDSTSESGTLNIYQDGKAVKIADDVREHSVTPDGQILYLCDDSLHDYRGELYLWNAGEAKTIDKDVTCIITIPENKYRGYRFPLL